MSVARAVLTVNCGCCWEGRATSMLISFGNADAGCGLGAEGPSATDGVDTVGPRKCGLTRIFCLGGTLMVGGTLPPTPMGRNGGMRLPRRTGNSGRCCMPGNLGRPKVPKPNGLTSGLIGADGRKGMRRRPLCCCCWFCMNMSIFCWSSWLTSVIAQPPVFNNNNNNKDEGKGPVLAIVLLSHTCNQKHFTILEVTADWPELMILQHPMQPSFAQVSEQQFAASRRTAASISHTRPSSHSL